jgi:hypothetical protein
MTTGGPNFSQDHSLEVAGRESDFAEPDSIPHDLHPGLPSLAEIEIRRAIPKPVKQADGFQRTDVDPGCEF